MYPSYKFTFRNAQCPLSTPQIILSFFENYEQQSRIIEMKIIFIKKTAHRNAQTSLKMRHFKNVLFRLKIKQNPSVTISIKPWTVAFT